MKAYHNTAVLKFDDEATGNAASGAPVTVRINSTQALSVIFDVDDVGIGNPLTTDSNGNYAFKAADNIYDIIVSEGTANEVKIEKVEIAEIPTAPILINDLSQAYEFPTVAAYKAFATTFPVGKVIRLLDRNAEFLVITGTGTANTFNIIASNEVSQSIDLSRDTIVTASQIGLLGDASDESIPLDILLTYGGLVDLERLDVLIESPVSASGESITLLNSGSVTYTGVTQQNFCLNLSFNNVIDSGGLSVDGADLCDKAFQCISANDARGVCILNGTEATRTKINAVSGALAGGIYIAGDYDLVLLNEVEASRVDHSEDTGQSARGINILQGAGQGAQRIVINTPKVSLVTPSNDGDGIVIQSDTVGAEVTINNLDSLNCAKRAIKTQIYKTTVNNPVIKRDISYPATTGGQIEIDAQHGNITVNNPTYKYLSDSTYPAGGLMSFIPERNSGNDGASPILNGGSCSFTDQANRTVGKLFECQSYVEDDVLKGGICRDFTFNGSIDTNNPILIRPLASSTFNKVLVDGFLVKGLYVEEILSANPAIISTDRSGTGYAFVNGLKIVDCIVSEQSTDVAQVHEVTTLVTATVDISAQNHRVINTPSANIADRPYAETIAQNAALAKVVTMPLNSSLRFTFMYTCGDNPATSSTYIDGIIQMDDGGDGAVIVELHENKTNALSGDISVTAVVNSGRFDVTFIKAVGSGTTSGRATITLAGGGFVQGQ